jgi:hypothetical protein
MMKNLMGNVMLNKRIKYFVCMLVFFALLFIGYKYFKAQSIIKDGEVLAGMVRIAEDSKLSSFSHLQELSKDTINSYYKKAATQAGPLGVKKAKANKQITARIRSGKTLNGYTPKDALTPDEAHTFKKRSTGMARARHSKIYNESFTPGELKFKDGSKAVVKEAEAAAKVAEEEAPAVEAEATEAAEAVEAPVEETAAAEAEAPAEEAADAEKAE